MKRDSIEVFLSAWGERLFHRPATPSLLSPLKYSWSSSGEPRWTLESEMLRADAGIRIARLASKARGSGSPGVAAKRGLLEALAEHEWILRTVKSLDAGDMASDPVVNLAAGWSEDGRMRLQLNSLLLSLGATVGTVASALNADPDAVACYAELFCNVIDRRDEPLFITAVVISPDFRGTAGQAHEAAWSPVLPGAAVHLPMSVTLARLGLDSGDAGESADADMAWITRMLCMACLEPSSVPVRSPVMRAILERHRTNIESRNRDSASLGESLRDTIRAIAVTASWGAEDEAPENGLEIQPECLPDAVVEDTPEEAVVEEPRFPEVDLTPLVAKTGAASRDDGPARSPLAFIRGGRSSTSGAGDPGWFAVAGVDRLWRLVLEAGRDPGLKSPIAASLPPWILAAADSAGSGEINRSPWFGVVRRAVELHHCPASRHLLQASLIARGATVEESAEWLRLPLAVVEAYAVLFFDTGGPLDRPWLRSRVIDQLEAGTDPAGDAAIHPGMLRLMRAAPRLTLDQLGDLSGCSWWMTGSEAIDMAANRLSGRLHELSHIRADSGSKSTGGGLAAGEWGEGLRLLARVLPDERNALAQGLANVMQGVIDSDEFKLASETAEANKLAMMRADAGEFFDDETGEDPACEDDPVFPSD